MISFYIKNLEGVWFGVAYDGGKVFSTAFAFSEKNVQQSLLNGIPFNVPFQCSEKASSFAERMLDLLKNVYDGKGGTQSFSLATEHLSNHAKKVIENCFSNSPGICVFLRFSCQGSWGKP